MLWVTFDWAAIMGFYAGKNTVNVAKQNYNKIIIVGIKSYNNSIIL